MNAHFFALKALISIIQLLATFELASDINRIHKVAIFCVLRHYINKTLANAFDNHMCATDSLLPSPLICAMLITNPETLAILPGSREIFEEDLYYSLSHCRIPCSHLAVHVSGKHDARVVRKQYQKSYEVTDMYNEGTLRDAFIEWTDLSIHYGLWRYWARIPQADLTDIGLQAKSISVGHPGTCWNHVENQHEYL